MTSGCWFGVGGFFGGGGMGGTAEKSALGKVANDLR